MVLMLHLGTGFINASIWIPWMAICFGVSGALMITCFTGMVFIHETPEWLLETRKFDKAIKALEFYQTDKKLLVTNDTNRNSNIGEERSYKDLVKLYRIESRRSGNGNNETTDDMLQEEQELAWK